MKILNLYAGIGGNRKLWKNCEVTAVEKNPEVAAIYARLYPDDNLIVGDAHEYLLNHFSEFDFIWTSPPCQSHSKMIKSGRNRKPRYPDYRLYEEIHLLVYDFKGFWVVENVEPYYKPHFPEYIKNIGRHYFWSNFQINQPFEIPEFKNFINEQNLTAKQNLMDWLDIHFEENIYLPGPSGKKNHCPTQVLRNCVHPKMGLHVYKEFLADKDKKGGLL